MVHMPIDGSRGIISYLASVLSLLNSDFAFNT